MLDARGAHVKCMAADAPRRVPSERGDGTPSYTETGENNCYLRMDPRMRATPGDVVALEDSYRFACLCKQRAT